MGFLSFISYVYLEDLFASSDSQQKQDPTNWIPKSPAKVEEPSPRF